MPADQEQRISPLTVITPITPGREATVRADLQNAIDQGLPLPLDEVGTVHFGRWVMLDEGGQSKLLLVTDYDGSWDVYFDDFIECAWEVLDAIYRNCEGFPERGARDTEGFKAYVKRHQLKEVAYYRAYRDASVKEIRSTLKFSRGAKQALEGLQELW